MSQTLEVETPKNDVQHSPVTYRRDAWWFEPLWTGAGFFVFVIYATWAAFQGQYYWHAPYLSPFYSPLLFIEPSMPGAAPLHHAWLGTWPQWWPQFLPPSPALIILAGPLSFRMTCYYYRKFYYRAYFMTPPACAVKSLPQKNYKGERGLFLFQNLHRYTLYIAIFYILVLFVDAFRSFFKDGQLGIGVGSIILLLNPILLSFYTFGCHAFRHLIGGKADSFSCCGGNKPTVGYTFWEKVTKLNEHHMFWAWVSMIWVGFTDLYVRMVSMGIWKDWNTWGN